MRAFLPTMVLSLAASLICVSWSSVPAEAQAPDAQQSLYKMAYSGQDQAPGQEQAEEPCGFLSGLCDPCDGGPRWIFTADTIALQRTNTRSQALFCDDFGAWSNALVNSKSVDFPVALGPKISGICRGVCGWDLEFVYFQVDGFDARFAVPGTSFMVTDVNGANFAVTDAQGRYTSALYNGELNLRYEVTDWATLMAGLRFGQLNERYMASGAGAVVRPTTVSLDADTFNHLYGLQLGADARVFDVGGPWQVNAFCKAAIFEDAASQSIHQSDTDPSNPTDQTLSARRDHATFLGETGVVITYAFTRNLAFRASAEATWLEGVALAPEQIGASNFAIGSATVNTTGSVFYYGGGLGLECRF